jgi:hypothetical protein
VLRKPVLRLASEWRMAHGHTALRADIRWCVSARLLGREVQGGYRMDDRVPVTIGLGR